MEEALNFVNILSSLFPRNRVFVQAVRTRINEDELERFYRDWKKKTDSVIIQKYDAFSGFLPDLSVADLSPLSRFPCWHLKRDLSVYINGDVPLCREDLFNHYTLGNLAAETLEKVWARGQEFHISHCKKDYSEICRGCDEYYTYNF